MNQLQVFRGTSADWTLGARLRNDSGRPSGYTDADPLTARLWPGDARPTLATPGVAWTAAAEGSFRLSLSDAQTAALDPGVYRVLVSTVKAGKTIVLAIVAVEVLEAPGEATAAAVYCTARDLQDLVGWVGSLFALDSDSTGWESQRRRAREWLDAMILDAWTGGGAGPLYSYAGVAPGVPDPYLSGLLEAGALVLTGPAGRKLVDCCACYALWLILSAQGAGNKALGDAARDFRRRARKVVYCTAGIDSNGDGVADFGIYLGNVNVRRG